MFILFRPLSITGKHSIFQGTLYVSHKTLSSSLKMKEAYTITTHVTVTHRSPIKLLSSFNGINLFLRKCIDFGRLWLNLARKV